jgi:probable blue pigment (indigoidine) exporter
VGDAAIGCLPADGGPFRTVDVRGPLVRTRPSVGHLGAAPSAAAAGAVMVAVIVIWGLGPPVTKLISAPPLVAVSMRFWLSVPLVWIVTYATGGRVTRAVLQRTALPGVLFGINLALVFAALQHSSVAVMAVIQTLQPGVVLLVAGRWLGERATGWHIGWTTVGVLGVAIAILGGDPEVRGSAVGVALCVGSMLTFTGYYLMNRRARSTTPISPMEWMSGVTLFAGLFITPIALATSSLDDYRQLAGADWLYLVFVAIVVGIVGHAMMSWAHRFIPAARSSLFLLAMNVVAIAVAWPIHDEPVEPIQAAGGLVVLVAVAAVLTRPASVRVVSIDGRSSAAASPTTNGHGSVDPARAAHPVEGHEHGTFVAGRVDEAGGVQPASP